MGARVNSFRTGAYKKFVSNRRNIQIEKSDLAGIADLNQSYVLLIAVHTLSYLLLE